MVIYKGYAYKIYNNFSINFKNSTAVFINKSDKTKKDNESNGVKITKINNEDIKFVKEFEAKVKRTVDKYKLATKKEKIIVACSGGKDSTAVLYLLKKLGYDVEGLIIDLFIGDWSKQNLDNIKGFCQLHNIKLHIVSMRDIFGCSICYIRSNIQTKVNLKNCAICGVIKRWLLNKRSRELKAIKLATGHNLDDQVETILMNILRGNPELSLGQLPVTGIIKDKKFVQRIKPLYFCTNQEVRRYSEILKFPVLYDPCPCSMTAFRRKVRNAIKLLEDDYPQLKTNVVNGFLNALPEMRSKYMKNSNNSKERLKYCEICAEPSKNNICQTCNLIKILKRSSNN
ncbi:MAG: TIGR00269 family protein [Candidatus Woesearchaeota archaeon]